MTVTMTIIIITIINIMSITITITIGATINGGDRRGRHMSQGCAYPTGKSDKNAQSTMTVTA
jgi:hypothetical protein